ncbi:hypothetical protein [Clostridium sp.]|uniref:hypothetical protein n=1 Tax=Clostridium sp. TaxID=1506 RepID=UPI00290DDD2D|nr:hypothetical protein [Clostridium sp.]MDU5107639.1 hypothetical protein [Clostridium sp.]
MNCGMVATVIVDNGYNDITIQFKDGTMVKYCHNDKFIKGEINNPNISKSTQIKTVQYKTKE